VLLIQEYLRALEENKADKEAEQYLPLEQVCERHNIDMDFLVRSNLIFHEQAGETIINSIRPTEFGSRWLVLSHQTCYIHKLDISEFLTWVARRRYQFYEVSFLDEEDQVQIGHLELFELKTFRFSVPSCYPLEKNIEIEDLHADPSEHVSSGLALNSEELDSVYKNIMRCQGALNSIDSIRKCYQTFRGSFVRESSELQKDVEKAKRNLMSKWLAKAIDENVFDNKLNSLKKSQSNT